MKRLITKDGLQIHYGELGEDTSDEDRLISTHPNFAADWFTPCSVTGDGDTFSQTALYAAHHPEGVRDSPARLIRPVACEIA